MGMQIAVALLASLAIAEAAESQVPAPARPLEYADLADLALPAPVVAQVRVARASRLKPAEAAGLKPGHSRFFVEAQVVSLIRGAGGLPSQVRFLADLPNAAGGKPPRLSKGVEWLVFAQPVTGRPSELRLLAQLPFQPATADRVRAILSEGSRADAAPQITGIGRAFHVPGSLPGESETQIFLQTADNRPVSLSILRRPGEAPSWSVALGEIVTDTAAAPARDTLLWYRLACTLPRQLPAFSTSEASPQEASAIRNDYLFVLDRLGPCPRTRR